MELGDVLQLTFNPRVKSSIANLGPKILTASELMFELLRSSDCTALLTLSSMKKMSQVRELDQLKKAQKLNLKFQAQPS